MYRIIIFIFITWFFFVALGNLSAQKRLKWGKIPSEELEMSVYPLDNSAEAVVLADVGSVEFSFLRGEAQIIFERHRRVKILKRSAFDQGDIEVAFRSGENLEKIIKIDAQVISPSGDITSLKKEDFYIEPINEQWSRVKFSIPNIKLGSVIEYQYKLESKYFFTLPEWYFQEDIPVCWSEYTVNIPEWYIYLNIKQGREIDIEETSDHSQIFTASGGLQGSGTASGRLLVKRIRMASKDIPALKEEAFITTMEDYYSKVVFQLKATNVNRIYNPVMTDWQTVAVELTESPSFGKQIAKAERRVKLSSQMIQKLSETTTEQDKAEVIYTYLSQSIAWDGTFRIYPENNLEICLEKKLGTSADLNLLFVALLRQQGVEAYPVLISTRSHGKMLPVYPILAQFNAVLAWARLDGKEVLVDLTVGDNLPFGTLHVQSLNGAAWVVNPDNPSWVLVTPPETKEMCKGKFRIDSTGTFMGSIFNMVNGYWAVNWKNEIRERELTDLFQQYLRKYYPDANVEEAVLRDVSNDVFSIEASCKITMAAQSIGDMMYFSPLLVPLVDENPFMQSERLFPVDIPYPFSMQYSWEIEIPRGYIIEELPEPINASLSDGQGKVTFFVNKVNENNIQVVSQFVVRKLRYMPSEYEQIKTLYDLLLEKQETQIVLRNKT